MKNTCLTLTADADLQGGWESIHKYEKKKKTNVRSEKQDVYYFLDKVEGLRRL